MDDTSDDAEIFLLKPIEMLEAIRSISVEPAPDDVRTYLLTRCGLVKDQKLTEAGKALFKLAWVLRRRSDAEAALGQALRQLAPLQVIEQDLRGLGPIPEEGVLDLLRQHRSAGPLRSATDMRVLLIWLSKVGVLSYSTKTKTVRSLAPSPDAALAGEVQAIAAMISPKTPYLNVVKLRRVLRPLQGIVWWADPHFGVRGLEEMAEELDTSKVSEIRILSGDGENVVSERSLKDFKRFSAEMALKSVAAEWRIDSKRSRDWHDRWLADDGSAWNVPPVNTLFKNDYSEIYPASERPPLQFWWDRSLPRI